MIEGRSTGKRFLGNGTPRARPSICPTQVPPDFGYSLTTYSGSTPESRRTMPALTRSFDLPASGASTSAPMEARASPNFRRRPIGPLPRAWRYLLLLHPVALVVLLVLVLDRAPGRGVGATLLPVLVFRGVEGLLVDLLGVLGQVCLDVVRQLRDL